MTGKLGNNAKLESNALSENHDPGGWEAAKRSWGVLSGIVLSGKESPLQGEGPDGSTASVSRSEGDAIGIKQPHGMARPIMSRVIVPQPDCATL